MNAIPAWLQRGIVILMPPASLLICCAVMLPRHNKLSDVNADIKTAQAGVRTYLTQLEEISKLPPDPTVATLPMTKQEQADFLRGLSTLCNRTGNKIVSVQSLAPPPAPPASAPGGAPPAPAAGALPPDVLAIKSPITFAGSFRSLRAFLKGLEGSRRLISLTEMRVGMDSARSNDLQTMLTVIRYVDRPGPPAVPPAPAPAGKT